MSSLPIVLAVTGASGSRYATRLLEVLLRANRSVYLTISPAAAEVYSQEIGGTIHLKQFVAADYLGSVSQELDLSLLKYQHFQDFRSGIASGSFLTAGMVICPCSLGTVAAVAQGTSSNLIHRAADVHLKERRKLILVPRETPLGIVQLRNLLAVAEAGAVVLPAMPALYTHPQSIQDMIDFIVGRICDQLGVFHQLFRRWGSA